MSSEFKKSPHIFRFLLGYKDIRVSADELTTVLNLCTKGSVCFYEVFSDDKHGYIRLPFFSALKLKKLLDQREISSEELRSAGIPSLLWQHRGRVGIPIGLILSVILIIVSGRVIWDVRIDGESKLTEQEVIKTLESCGLSVGTPLSSVKSDVIENRVLILSDDIAWISINLRGTVANVEIRELAPLPENDDPTAANIVADSAGVIVSLEDVRGTVAVNVGEAVSEGQLLVSGIKGDEDLGIGYICAKGKVFAECEQSFEVNIPRIYRKKIYTGSEKCEKYLIFFKKEIKFFSNCGNLYTSYDKIDMVEYFPSPSGDDLPVGIRTVRYVEYVYTEQTRSDDELLALAEYRMSLSLFSGLKDAQLLKKSTVFDISDSGYRMCCDVKCIKNIAKIKEIEIQP